LVEMPAKRSTDAYRTAVRTKSSPVSLVLAVPAWVLGTSWFVLAERRNREEPIEA